jgi:RNA polymerase sigma factor (sigma-70 family)
MRKTKDEENLMVRRAKLGDPEAVDTLLEYLKLEKAPAVYRVVAARSNMYDRDFDDFMQEFLIGAYEGLKTVNVDQSPMGWIVQKGLWKSKDYLRSGYRRLIFQYCDICHRRTQVANKNREPYCPHCGNQDPATLHRNNTYTPIDMTAPDSVGSMLEDGHNLIGELETQTIMLEFLARLSGRTLDIARAILVDGIDRDSSRNYQREVAESLGISQSNVNIRLRQVRKALTEFLNEREAD